MASPFVLELDVPPRRAVASVNVRHDDKALFDAIQAWMTFQRGAPVNQWDAFTAVLAAALENEAFAAGRALAGLRPAGGPAR